MSIDNLILEILNEFKDSEDYNIILGQKLLGVDNKVTLTKKYNENDVYYSQGIYSVKLVVSVEELFNRRPMLLSLKLYCDSGFLYSYGRNLKDTYSIPDYSIIIKSDNYSPSSLPIVILNYLAKYRSKVSLSNHRYQLSEYLKNNRFPLSFYKSLCNLDVTDMSVDNLVFSGCLNLTNIKIVMDILDNKSGIFDIRKSKIVINLSTFGLSNNKKTSLLYKLYKSLKGTGVNCNSSSFVLQLNPQEFGAYLTYSVLSEYFTIEL